MQFPFARIESFIETAEREMMKHMDREEIAGFWHWLGNVKYEQDEGGLTTERAAEIIKKMPELVKEWLEE